MVTVGSYLDANRTSKISHGMKAKRNYEVITHNPNSINAGGELYVKIPQLEEGRVIVPKSLRLTFKLTTDSKVADTANAAAAKFTSNVGRNIVDTIIMKIGGRTINQIEKAYIINTFKDFWLTEKQRTNAVMQGIKSERSGAIKTAFGDRYSIPIESEIFDDHMPFYPSALLESVEYHIKFNDPKYMITGESTKRNYSVENIQLEYETVYNLELADEIETMYNTRMRWMYENIHLLKTENIGTKKGVNITVDVNRASTKGILLFFQKPFTEYDSEKTSYQNPDITNVTITSEGISHCIFTSGIKAYNHYDEIKRFFLKENLKQEEDILMDVTKYFGDEKYALWIDLRSTEDNTLHGSGTAMSNIKHGLQLELTRSTTNIYNMRVYIVADALIALDNGKISGVIY